MDIKVENRNRSFLQQLMHLTMALQHSLYENHTPKEHELQLM